MGGIITTVLLRDCPTKRRVVNVEGLNMSLNPKNAKMSVRHVVKS